MKKQMCRSSDKNAPSTKQLLIELYSEENKKFICKCGKKYSHNTTLSAHQKKCNDQQQDLLRIELDKVKKDLEELKNIHKLTTNSNINSNNSNINSNNTINNTIVVNNFGEEDLSKLSKEFLEFCLGRMSQGIERLTQEIHLNKNKPENHTIKVTNIKSPYVSVMKDGKWIYKKKDDALSDLIWKENQMLKYHYEENETDIKMKWTENKLESVQRWLDQMDDENKELWDRLKEQIFLLLVNNRDIIMKNM
jgi:hypothetical protein